MRRGVLAAGVVNFLKTVEGRLGKRAARAALWGFVAHGRLYDELGIDGNQFLLFPPRHAKYPLPGG
jgi:hypothetical protein